MLEFTGERMVPHGADSNTFWEHVERYRFACRYASGRDILDIACGEGYGSAALVRAGAHSVLGIDVSPEAVQHAKATYKVDARVGRAESIPVSHRSMDLIVSFETIEHVPNPETFVKECRRVLRTDGKLLMSTPNLSVYCDGTPENPYHCSEMSLDQFEELLKKYFKQVDIFGQSLPVPRWGTVRGGGCLWRFCRRRITPGRDTLDQFARDRVVELCLRKPTYLECYFSLDGVRKMRRRALASCRYVVACAAGPVF